MMHCDVVKSDELYHVLKRAQKMWPAEYNEVWIPYISKFPHHFRGGIARVGTASSLKQRLHLLPFALFHAYFRHINSFIIDPSMNHIESMHLRIRPKGLTHIDRIESFFSQPFENLKSLCIRTHTLGVELASIVATMENQAPLELIQLGVNRGSGGIPPESQIGDSGVKILTSSSVLEKVSALYLQSCGLTAKGVRELVESPYVRTLKVLDVSGNAIGDDGVELLAKSEALKSLCSLRIRSPHYRECGAPHGISESGWNMIEQSDTLSEPVKRQIRDYSLHQHFKIVGRWWLFAPSG
jgi:hypothetical protein